MSRLHFIILFILVTLTLALPWNLSITGTTEIRQAQTSPDPKILILKRKRASLRRRRLAKRNTADLALADGDAEYVVQLTVGAPLEPQQTFELPVDTGSSDTWVAGADFQCQDSIPDCQPGSLFAPGRSYTPLNATLNDIYGDGQILGSFGTDTLTLAGISVWNATLGVISAGSWGFNGATSGLLGMGGAALSTLFYPGDSEPVTYDPIFVQMYKLGLVPANFTLALGLQQGYMGLGSMPDVPHNPNWANSPMPPYSDDPVNGTVYGYYFVAVDSLMVSTPPGPHSSSVREVRYMDWMMVDSGTSVNILPDPIANALNEVWDPKPDPNEGTIPCDVSAFKAIPKLGVAIGGFTFYHAPASLISQYPNGQCVSAIQPSGDQAPIILGTPFLQNTVVTFDIANQQMLLASTNPAQLGTAAGNSNLSPLHEILVSGSSKDIVV